MQHDQQDVGEVEQDGYERITSMNGRIDSLAVRRRRGYIAEYEQEGNGRTDWGGRRGGECMITGEHAVPRVSIGARDPLSVIQKQATTVSHRRREWAGEEPGGLYRASGVDSRSAMTTRERSR